MKKAILSTLFIFFACSLGCNSQYEESKLTNFDSDNTFVTLDEVKMLAELDMGVVPVRRDANDSPWSNAIVKPFRQIPVGTKVKVFLLSYAHDGPTGEIEVLVVQ